MPELNANIVGAIEAIAEFHGEPPKMAKGPPRPRVVYLELLALTVIAGLASRHFAAHPPAILAKNAGDILYATMVYFLAVVLLPRLGIASAAGGSLLLCFLIELWKLDQAPWLVAFRQTTLGGLILGHVFTPSNFLCYAVGVGIGVLLDVSLRRIAGKGQPTD